MNSIVLQGKRVQEEWTDTEKEIDVLQTAEINPILVKIKLLW